jgi:hypothetical protein
MQNTPLLIACTRVALKVVVKYLDISWASKSEIVKGLCLRISYAQSLAREQFHQPN